MNDFDIAMNELEKVLGDPPGISAAIRCGALWGLIDIYWSKFSPEVQAGMVGAINERVSEEREKIR